MTDHNPVLEAMARAIAGKGQVSYERAPAFYRNQALAALTVVLDMFREPSK